MKNTVSRKKLLLSAAALLLGAVLFASAVFGFSAAAEDVAAAPEPTVLNGECGAGLTWRFDPAVSTLYIEGAGRMLGWEVNTYSYNGGVCSVSWIDNIPAPWFELRDYVSSVVISDGVTEIGSYAFFAFRFVTEFVLPDSVTFVGENAFMLCESLTKITFGAGLTSLDEYAFVECPRLCSFVIPESCAFYSTDGYAIFNKDKTELLYFPAAYPFDTYTAPATVTKTAAFAKCKGLREVVLPGVSVIPDLAFYGCAGLEKITIGGSEPAEIGNGAFSGCVSLQEIFFGGITPAVIKEDAFKSVPISAVFYFPDGEESWTAPLLTGPDGNVYCSCPVSKKGNYGLVYSAEEDGYRFIENGKAVTGWVQFGLDKCYFDPATGLMRKEDGVIDGVYCRFTADGKVIRVLASGTTGAAVKWVLESDGTMTLTGTGNTGSYDSSETTPWFHYRQLIRSLVVGDGITAVGKYTFEGCQNLKKVVLGKDVELIGAAAFGSCTYLPEIVFPDKVRVIGESALSNCFRLEKVVLGKSVNSVKRRFVKECHLLDEIVFTGPRPEFAADAFEGSYQGITAVYFVAGGEGWSAGNIEGVPVSVWKPFDDVSEISWFYSPIINAYLDGLMVGTSDRIFLPDSSLTRAQAITLAARVSDLCAGGSGVFEQSGVWYSVYVDYAVEKGIITPEYAASAVMDGVIPRGEMAALFAAAVPEGYLAEINDVTALPDVDGTTAYSEAIFALYRAGVLTGNDDIGTFAPESGVTRAQAAAIITRVLNASERKLLPFCEPILPETADGLEITETEIPENGEAEGSETLPPSEEGETEPAENDK